MINNFKCFRWAQIAAQLRGRTLNNEKKNFWNSSLKKKLMKQGIDPATHKPFINNESLIKEEKEKPSMIMAMYILYNILMTMCLKCGLDLIIQPPLFL
jgi:hypothetical protein